MDQNKNIYWQNDSVEFIEAAPGARLCEAFKNPSETLVIHLVGAVEDHTVLPKCLCHVFHRLRFPSAYNFISRVQQLKVQKLPYAFSLSLQNHLKKYESISCAKVVIYRSKILREKNCLSKIFVDNYTCRSSWGTSHAHAKCLSSLQVSLL